MNFETEVIERSSEKPIVVDFWAPWCGPCQALGPVIEELADEAGGSWELVKVNTDEYPDLMQRFNIKGIPAVKMFHQGEIVAEFGGALPKFQIEKWLALHLPTEEKLTFAEIKSGLESGNDDLTVLEAFVEAHPDFLEAKILLAKQVIFREPQRANSLTAEVRPGNSLYYQVEPLSHLQELIDLEPKDQSNTEVKLLEVKNHLSQADYDKALETLISVVMVDKSFNKDLPRRATIALFQWLGSDHELTKKYRRRFDMALY